MFFYIPRTNPPATDFPPTEWPKTDHWTEGLETVELIRCPSASAARRILRLDSCLSQVRPCNID